MRRVTIQDVAKAAGVSASSVSHLLNNRHHHMRAETRERIQAVIEALGYAPSHAALHLRTGKSPLIGLLVPTVANPFFGELAVELEQAAKEQGFRVILCNTLQSASTERALWDSLASLGVKGVVCSSALVTNDELQGYVDRGLCVVALDEKQPGELPPSVDFVSIDHRKSIGMAVDHLAGLGHRRIAYIADGSSTTFSRRSKEEGFIEAGAANRLTEYRVIMPSQQPAIPQFSGKELAKLGRRAVDRILMEFPKATAIVTFNDMTALGAVEALKERAVSVPGRFSVVGIDGVSISELLTPSMTSVRQPLETSAREAIACVAEQMLDGRRKRKDVIVEPELIVRSSSGPPPSED